AGPVPVITHQVGRHEYVEQIEALGTVQANESVTLTAQVAERVQKIHFEDGQLVEEGDVLLEFTSEEESALLAEAQATLSEAEQQLARIRELVAGGNATQARLDEQLRITRGAQARVNAIEARLDDRLLKAPFDGILGFRRVSPGTLVEPGTAVTTLDDIEPVKLDFSVPESYLAVLRPDLPIKASSVAYDEQVFEGRVQTVMSRVNPVTRAVTVRALLPNEDKLLRPGMLLTVKLVRGRDQVVMIPEESLIPREEKQFVYVIGDDNTVIERQVRLGRRQQGAVEITAGLDSGETIIVEGTTRVRPGAQIKVRSTRDLSPPEEPNFPTPPQEKEAHQKNRSENSVAAKASAGAGEG
ncbi:MAG: efflux RND transporter periplasmic adaptor subunit, partial [Alphaproteobacteria bacterium]|nr:efflux RND transporter periplasmic adaptor subunit [Alphaproteobacteria bacterium]